jgi:hypothetical protein
VDIEPESDDDDPNQIKGMLTWNPKESAVLFYDAMFGFYQNQNRSGDPVGVFVLPEHQIRFELKPWSNSMEMAIKNAAVNPDTCNLNQHFVSHSIRNADLILFASEPMDDTIQAIVTVFSGFKDTKRKCLPHEWYVDVACSAPETRSVVNLFKILTFMAHANQIQAIRLHSTESAYSYWTNRRMFREAETIRDATGRCLYSVPVLETEPDDPHLTRLVSIISELPLPQPHGEARKCLVHRPKNSDMVITRKPATHKNKSGERRTIHDSAVSSSSFTTSEPVIYLPWRNTP